MNAFGGLPESLNSPKVDDHWQQADKIMCEDDCERFPVLDGDGREVGAITARDICLAAYRSGAGPFWHTGVDTAMANPTTSGATRR
jgi:CBS domain-containing protein